ncbi:MAG: BON domain-containing protein [Chloroflexi bacterium]|nr:BON domain-containing protein [Chloroflexota bacterium]
MAEEIRGERFEGREPYRERAVEPHVFAMGDHGPFPGTAPSRPDEDIRRDVESALFYDEAVSSLGITVTVQDGVVTLSGTVGSTLAKQLAIEDAWTVAGVREVRDGLTVHETPTPSRAAGQDVVPAKPPMPGYGLPLESPAAGAETRAAPEISSPSASADPPGH